MASLNELHHLWYVRSCPAINVTIQCALTSTGRISRHAIDLTRRNQVAVRICHQTSDDTTTGRGSVSLHPFDANGTANMQSQRRHSVVFRLMTCMVLGGIFLSCCVAWVEMHRAKVLTQVKITQESQLLARNIQNILRKAYKDSPRFPNTNLLHESIAPMMNVDFITSARIRFPDQQPVILGPWPTNQESNAIVWPLSEYAVASGLEVDQSRMTLIQAPFKIHDRTVTVELLVDGRISIWRGGCEPGSRALRPRAGPPVRGLGARPPRSPPHPAARQWVGSQGAAGRWPAEVR